MIQVSKPDFPIGKLLATPAALEALQESDVDIIDLVERHICKDWGDLSDEDKRLNDEALHDGSRILSAYTLPTEVKIWIITEAADDSGERASGNDGVATGRILIGWPNAVTGCIGRGLSAWPESAARNQSIPQHIRRAFAEVVASRLYVSVVGGSA